MRSATRVTARGETRRSPRRLSFIALCTVSGLFGLTAWSSSATAGTTERPSVAVPRAASPPSGPAQALDSRALESFFDAQIPGRLRDHHVPGVTISVVSDGRTVFSKGYGQADVEDRKGFDPETSLVRIASISKLFTWTAVMQLVEQGKLDLNADVNRYLTAFHIPPAYGRPVTLLELMNHTAGFEGDRTTGEGGRSKAEVPPLGTYLAQHMPARVRPPGEISSYSNYGAALAGYIVAQVSGERYEQYVQDHILTPLGMRHTTAWEPVPAALAGGQARSYEYSGGKYVRKPFIFDKLVPDGSISTTANDMARFMAAHLQNGRLGGTQVLSEATAELMHQRSFAADPRLSGYAHGFKESTVNGHRAIGHDGGWEAFLSEMLLVPDAHLGLFLSVNSDTDAVDAVRGLNTAFFDRFLPAAGTPAVGKPAAGTSVPRPRDGFYRPAASSETTISKLLTLLGSARLHVLADGKLKFQNKTWTPIGPNLYQQAGGTDRIAFVTGARSGRTYLATEATSFERLPSQDTIQFNLIVLLGFALLALTAVLGFPLAAAVRRLTKRSSNASRPWRAARWITVAAGAVGIVFTALLALTMVGDTSEFIYGVPVAFRVLLVLPVLLTCLITAGVVTTIMAWPSGRAGVLVRVHQVALLAGLLGMVWFCVHWNLLGWHFG